MKAGETNSEAGRKAVELNTTIAAVARRTSKSETTVRNWWDRKIKVSGKRCYGNRPMFEMLCKATAAGIDDR